MKDQATKRRGWHRLWFFVPGVILAMCGWGGMLFLRELADPPLGEPVPIGATVADVGEIRPGHFDRDRMFAELPKARGASAEVLRDYDGIMRLRHPGLTEAMITFRDGKRSRDDIGTPPPVALQRRISPGMTAIEAVRRFHPRTDVRLGNRRQ